MLGCQDHLASAVGEGEFLDKKGAIGSHFGVRAAATQGQCLAQRDRSGLAETLSHVHETVNRRALGRQQAKIVIAEQGWFSDPRPARRIDPASFRTAGLIGGMARDRHLAPGRAGGETWMGHIGRRHLINPSLSCA